MLFLNIATRYFWVSQLLTAMIPSNENKVCQQSHSQSCRRALKYKLRYYIITLYHMLNCKNIRENRVDINVVVKKIVQSNCSIMKGTMSFTTSKYTFNQAIALMQHLSALYFSVKGNIYIKLARSTKR